jgi:hypothetical protein
MNNLIELKKRGDYSWQGNRTKFRSNGFGKLAKDFRVFLNETDFPDPERFSEYGPTFKYPEWLIMFIAILSVKLKVKTYIQIHKMALKYWDVIGEDLNIDPISERQLRDRLKKSAISLESRQRSSFSSFPDLDNDNVVSGDKMMINAEGPVRHKKHKEKGIIPNGLRGLDQQAAWCKSGTDKWVYGHGTFSLT